jgi:hypothetical protein
MARRIRADFNDWAIHIKFQSTDDDLVLIDSLYGRDALPHNASSEEIKAEALAQALRDSTYEDGFKGA